MTTQIGTSAKEGCPYHGYEVSHKVLYNGRGFEMSESVKQFWMCHFCGASQPVEEKEMTE